MARLAPPDARAQALFDVLRDGPTATARYFAAWAGTLPVSAFFARENLESLIHHGINPPHSPPPSPRSGKEIPTIPLVV
jgi:hypothetical protein